MRKLQVPDFKKMNQREFHEKIVELCVKTEKQAQVRREVLESLQFTKDNYLKLVLIYFRLRSRQPVIIMGETGVGKTSLV